MFFLIARLLKAWTRPIPGPTGEGSRDHLAHADGGEPADWGPRVYLPGHGDISLRRALPRVAAMEKPELVCECITQHSGYLRQAGIERAMVLNDTRYLPLLAARLNDWSAPVRQAAQQALAHYRSTHPAADFVPALAALHGAARGQRSDHAWIAAFVQGLDADDTADWLKPALASRDAPLRRAAYALAMDYLPQRLPKLTGAIGFDQVSFRYRPEASDVIRSLTLNIRAGEVIGIVGRSGSGKSTLTKLVQRLYVCDRGRVLIDGQDLAIIDTASLRQQIGVVLQENMLFSRSIRDNIALTDPSLPIEAVMAAARLAGAHEFICELPEAYDTLVGEHGTGLSGGQRQRIAIARALISNPAILIFDEATSALDYESEKIIQDNMRQICAGRTVLIIAHRLSAVRDAHRILVMDKGQIVESGRHEELLRNPGGIYTHLHRLQMSQGAASASSVS